MKTKFTKGEWTYCNYTRRIKTKNSYICEMWGTATEEGLANTKLISAAPDLFEACKQALHILDSENIYGKTRLLIEAAMQKAIGK